MELHIGGDLWVDIQDLVDHGRAAPGQVGEGGGRRCLLLHHRRPQARVPGRPAGCCLVMVDYHREIWSYIIGETCLFLFLLPDLGSPEFALFGQSAVEESFTVLSKF